MTGTSHDLPTVLVTVGSDHHPARRLLGAVSSWARARSGEVRVIAQRGPLGPLDGLEGDQFLPKDQLLSLMSSAAVVVCTGGPATIAECMATGRRPVVVPRRARLGEVVDDHQLAYTRRLAAEGAIVLVENVDELGEVVDRLLADTSALVLPQQRNAPVEEAHHAFRDLVEEAAASRDVDLPPVLMLGGFGRSGSTLLERMLGDIPGVVSIGEVLHLWERGLRDDERCGCGAAFSDCPFWAAVGDDAFGGWHKVAADGAVADRQDVVRNRHLLGLVTGLQPTSRRLRRHRMLARHRAIYRAAAAQAGASLVVDSSKHPAFAYLMRRGRLDLRCLIVVRDPRGVAWSWQKTVRRPEVTSQAADMPRYPVVGSGLRWTLYGVLFHALSLLGVPVAVIRYEDLLADPRGELERVMRFSGVRAVQPDDLSHVSGSAVTMSVHHTVAGNPMRFQTGEVALRPDTEWRERMPRRDRLLVEAVTAPLRIFYGYGR